VQTSASILALAIVGCGHELPEPAPGEPTVVFTYPRDHQLDVPLGTRLIVAYSQPVDVQPAVVGPDGNVEIDVATIADGNTLAITSKAFLPGTEYEVHAGGDQPLFRFTTRSVRPLAGPPTLIAIDGSDPQSPGDFRPIADTSTIQLVFSEPLDPRSVALEPGAIELVDADGVAVPATLLAHGIHVTIDPAGTLVAGRPYELRLGDQLIDAGGEHLATTAIQFTPIATLGPGSVVQTLRTRLPEDPGGKILATGEGNVMDLAHPLIGSTSGHVLQGALRTQLGDPTLLGGPIAFTIPRGQRLSSTGLDVALAGAIPSGLTTGEIRIELLADAGGRIYRGKDDALLVDLSLDLGIYATDPTGNAVLAQTVLGAQLCGHAIADEHVLAIETAGTIDIGLLGIAEAPTNLVLDLISDPTVVVDADTQAPTLVASLPAADSHDLAPDDGIELMFDEPIDVDRARDGGISVRDSAGRPIAATLEQHGSVIVVRPRAPLADGMDVHVQLDGVVDRAGNAMPQQTLALGTQRVVASDVPLAVEAIVPGVPCALVDGRCAGANPRDDTYKPAALAANERIAIVFDQPVRASSVTLGDRCDTGSVRVEAINAAGTCAGAIRGTLLRHQRDLAFVPEQPWPIGARFRLRLVSGTNATCDAGELCGANGKAANFDPLRGATANAGGGPDLVVDFVGASASTKSSLIAAAMPASDLNGSGRIETGEVTGDVNRVALRIAGTSGALGFANFPGGDCDPQTPEVEGCMYLDGAIPAQLGDARTDCALPDGTIAATCVPVTMTPQVMYSTSLSMTAGALGIGIPADTGMSVMRMRDRADGPLEGYIVDRGGTPTLVTALELYMDAPDMSLPLAQHDMHSKPLSVLLEGPVTFRPDGRLSLALRNVADVPISVGINALGITGAVNLVVPTGEMRLQLLTPPQRGRLP
jgi:Big-like domain-containing protein